MSRTWDELDALFETKVARIAPLVDAADEVWALRLDRFVYRLLVWRDGRVIESCATPDSPVRRREAAFDLFRSTVIELEHGDETVVVRRAQLNGALHTACEPAGPRGFERERALGFRPASAWEVPPFGRVHRQYLREREVWVISVAGDEVRQTGGARWHDDPRTERLGSPDAAIARAEELIAERTRAGFALRLIELLDETQWHEAPPFTPSADPYTAVDAAVEQIRALTRSQPRGHFVIEERDPVRDAAVLDELGYGEFFIDMHRESFDRWSAIAAAPRAGSSFEYFLARYRSLTWIVGSCVASGLPTFYCGNVSGGGWCCLELADLDYDTSGADGLYPDRGYARGRVFHGGWGRYGYIMDTRVASAAGEHPIYRFSDDGPIDRDDLMPETPADPAAIEPFGCWLERHVHELVSEISHRLPFVNG